LRWIWKVLTLHFPLLQAVTLLRAGDKSSMTLDTITRDLCSQLSMRQLYRLCSTFRADQAKTQAFSNEVLSEDAADAD
jgi:hypothetical protein